MNRVHDTAAALTIQPVSRERGIWMISGDTNGYMIARGDVSILIDCPRGDIGGLLAEAGLPTPDYVLHTQVQAEHCGEWASFPEVPVLVPRGLEDLAAVSERFIAASKTVWGPERAWDSRGAEEYGIAGCMTARPPERPLAVSGTLEPGNVFTWQDIELEVIALPGSDARAIGFNWRDAGVFFSGDSLHAGGWCVNLYDVERSYGIPTGYSELRESLQMVRGLAPDVMYPSTGPVITDPSADIATCLARTEWIFSPPIRRAQRKSSLTNFEPMCVIGNYREVLPGLYQQTTFGNVIIYVAPNGDAIMVDPGPCYWLPTWEETCAAMNSDLDLLEREAGLRRVAAVLITHFHGDHADCADLVRDRYDAQVLAPPDVAAVLERPEEFPYPCRVPWYGFPFERVRFDDYLQYGRAVELAGTCVTPLHLPGHCLAQVGYLIPWEGETTACTGDTIQYGDGPISFGPPIVYNDAGGPGRTVSSACRTLKEHKPTVLLGGHSHCCFDADGSILEDILSAALETDSKLAEMVPPGKLDVATTPPGFAEVRLP